MQTFDGKGISILLPDIDDIGIEYLYESGIFNDS